MKRGFEPLVADGASGTLLISSLAASAACWLAFSFLFRKLASHPLDTFGTAVSSFPPVSLSSCVPSSPFFSMQPPFSPVLGKLGVVLSNTNPTVGV